MISTLKSLNFCCQVKGEHFDNSFNSSQNNEILDLPKWKEFADNKVKCSTNDENPIFKG